MSVCPVAFHWLSESSRLRRVGQASVCYQCPNGNNLERIEGLLLLSIQSIQGPYAYASDVGMAYRDAISSDEKRRASGQRVMAALHDALAAERKHYWDGLLSCARKKGDQFISHAWEKRMGGIGKSS
jgi:hypothetical protein